ncbi:uncharacterized protein [Emydura macquarii macquarii]|uniref:uncharacterized protein isoform X1 n=2 Tax=Emydura macquarii macquarii TaxID=1129001 RepID=UPI00352BA2BE
MEQSTLPKPGTAQPEVSQYKDLDHRKGDSEETYRGEREAPQGELANLDGTKMEQPVNYVEDNLRREMNARFESLEKRIQVLEEELSFREHSTMVSAEEFHQKEKECEKLKEEKRAIEKRLEHVLANAMKSHKFSENLNDPCRESVVLEMYDRLTRHEWEKAKYAASGSAFPMTYERSSTIIKAVFNKCEEDLSQKMRPIFELLQIPISNETTSLFDSEQLSLGLVREIKNHLKNLYFNYREDFYQAMSGPLFSPDLQKFHPLVKFAAESYKIYCLLLLQNPPIRAVWYTQERIPTACVEHVDKKDLDDRMPLNFLWPVLACEGKVLRQGVVYDLMQSCLESDYTAVIKQFKKK